MLTRILSTSILVLTLLVSGACGKTVSSGALIPVTIGYSSLTCDDLPLFVAADQGLFAKNGLTVSLQHMDTGPVVVSALVSGSAQAVMASGGSAASAASHGADVMVIAGGVQRMSMIYFGSAEVASGKKKIKTVFAVKGGESGDALVLAEEHGLLPATVTPVSIAAGESTKIEALKHGELDAAPMAVSVASEAKAAGLVELFSMDKFDYPASVLMTTSGLIKNQSDVIRRILSAYLEANELIVSDPTSTIKTISSHLGLNGARASEAYVAYRGYFSDSPVVKTDDFKLVKDGDRVRINNSLVEEVVKGRA